MNKFLCLFPLVDFEVLEADYQFYYQNFEHKGQLILLHDNAMNYLGPLYKAFDKKNELKHLDLLLDYYHVLVVVEKDNLQVCYYITAMEIFQAIEAGNWHSNSFLA